MPMNGPRLRAKLRQADKVAANGKRAAAEELYQEIISEAPNAANAWAGLGEVAVSEKEQEEAFNKALALDPENRRALLGLAQLRGEVIELPEEEEAPEPEPEPEPEPQATAVAEPDQEAETTYKLYCYRHPNKETALRCYTCGNPICMKCAQKTAVGYACPDCIRGLEDKYFNSQPSDYIVAPVVAFILSLIGGVALTFLGAVAGFFFFIILFFAGGAVGSFIGGLTKRAIGRRRGRSLPLIVAVVTIIGTILPGFILGFNFFAIIIYLVIATPAIYYQMR